MPKSQGRNRYAAVAPDTQASAFIVSHLWFSVREIIRINICINFALLFLKG